MSDGKSYGRSRLRAGGHLRTALHGPLYGCSPRRRLAGDEPGFYNSYTRELLLYHLPVIIAESSPNYYQFLCQLLSLHLKYDHVRTAL